MNDTERLKQIQKLVQERRTISVRELAGALFVSESTIRRDLTMLEKEKSVVRIHGGAMSGPMLKSETFSYRKRQMEMPQAKEAIAEMAACMVHRGETVFLDGSTTGEAIARKLPVDMELHVVTTGIKSAEVLADRGIDTVISGGLLREDMGSVIGYHNEMLIRSIRADILFCSARGLSLDGVFSTSNTDEAATNMMLMENTRKVVLCVTSNKIGMNYPMAFSRIEDVDEVLCEKPIPQTLREHVGLKRKRIRYQTERETDE